MLHNIRSTHNVGSIFRTAEGLGVNKIICSGYTPHPKLSSDSRLPHIAQKLHQQIHKTALGAEELVPFEHQSDITIWLSNQSLPIIALEQTNNSVQLNEFKPPSQMILLLGEEVLGINDELLTLADTTIEIPMKGKKESFNVSVAAGIALYHLLACW